MQQLRILADEGKRMAQALDTFAAQASGEAFDLNVSESLEYGDDWLYNFAEGDHATPPECIREACWVKNATTF